MADEWWDTDAEIEAEPGVPVEPEPRGLSEIELYNAPKTITASWVEKQLTKAEWKSFKNSRLGPHLIEAMCKDASKGLSKRAIMARAGYSLDSWYLWVQKAEEGVEPYSLWYRCMLIAIAKAEGELIDLVKLGAQGDWKAAKWLLEQLNKGEYGPTPVQQTVNVHGDVNQTNEHSVNYLSQDDAVDVARIMQQIGVIPRSAPPAIEGEVIDESDD